VGEVACRSRVRIGRIRGPLRRAYPSLWTPNFDRLFPGEIADHYGVPCGSDVERATTLDYLVAAGRGLTDEDVRRRAGGTTTRREKGG